MNLTFRKRKVGGYLIFLIPAGIYLITYLIDKVKFSIEVIYGLMILSVITVILFLLFINILNWSKQYEKKHR